MTIQIESMHAGSSLAQTLLNNSHNINALRVWGDKDVPGAFINNATNDDCIRVNNTNYTLLKDEWIQIDRAVNDVRRKRRGILDAIETAGSVYNLGTGLGKTKLEYQNVSNIGDADISMDGIVRGNFDRPQHDLTSMPLPLIHKDFQYTSREIAVSRNEGVPLDVATARSAAQRVLEYIEELFAGTKTYTDLGGSIYGLLNYTGKNTYSLAGDWAQIDSSAASGETIIEDVRGMKQALINDRYHGPYTLFIPTNYETVLDADFKADSDKTIRQRIMEVNNIEKIVVSDFLTSSNVVLAQLTSDVIEAVTALDLTTVEWQSQGGFELNFKVLAMIYPRCRQDYEGNCGIVVGS